MTPTPSSCTAPLRSGPGSPYAERVYGSLTRGEAIIPLTYDQAQKWVETHLSADERERIFGIPDEGGEAVQIALEISPRTRAQLDRLRSETGKTLAQIIAEAVEALLG